jgi:hypothetical protein
MAESLAGKETAIRDHKGKDLRNLIDPIQSEGKGFIKSVDGNRVITDERKARWSATIQERYLRNECFKCGKPRHRGSPCLGVQTDLSRGMKSQGGLKKVLTKTDLEKGYSIVNAVGKHNNLDTALDSRSGLINDFTDKLPDITTSIIDKFPNVTESKGTNGIQTNQNKSKSQTSDYKKSNYLEQLYFTENNQAQKEEEDRRIRKGGSSSWEERKEILKQRTKTTGALIKQVQNAKAMIFEGLFAGTKQRFLIDSGCTTIVVGEIADRQTEPAREIREAIKSRIRKYDSRPNKSNIKRKKRNSRKI